MMDVQRMLKPRGPQGEPVASLLGGAPSLTIGVGCIILMISYMTERPIGPADFYEVGRFPAYRPSEPQPFQTTTTMIEHVLPSGRLFEWLAVGTLCGVLGAYGGNRRRAGRRPSTAIAGAITCGVAFLLAWVRIMMASTW